MQTAEAGLVVRDRPPQSRRRAAPAPPGRAVAEPAALWVLFVLVTNWVGLIAYLIAVRTQQPERA